MMFPKLTAPVAACLLMVSGGTLSSVGADKPAPSSSSPRNKVFSTKSFVHSLQGGAAGSALLGKNEEATTSLEVSIPLSQATALEKDRDGPLMKDIGMLSDILSNLIQQEDPKVKEIYEEFQKLGISRYVHTLYNMYMHKVWLVGCFITGYACLWYLFTQNQRSSPFAFSQYRIIVVSFRSRQCHQSK